MAAKAVYNIQKPQNDSHNDDTESTYHIFYIAMLNYFYFHFHCILIENCNKIIFKENLLSLVQKWTILA